MNHYLGTDSLLADDLELLGALPIPRAVRPERFRAMARKWVVTGLRRDLVQITFEEWFGITGAQSEVLVAMYEAGGEMRKYKDLAMLVSSHRPPSRNAFEVRIHELRKALESEAIDTGPAGLYGLTEIGMAECRKAMAEMGDVLHAVSVAA